MIEKRSCLVVGLDPMLERLPGEVRARMGGWEPKSGGRAAINTAKASLGLALFSNEVIKAVAPFAVAVKPNSAFFERFGAAGWDALQQVCRQAKKEGLLVILDAKRGDLESTAAAYAEALLGDLEDTPGPAVDALTINPYFGIDGVRPFLETARPRGKGLFVLVRTSNPSAADFQDLDAGGEPFYLRVARAVARWAQESREASGWSPVGVVVGGTAPEPARRIRELLPSSFFLVPGYGAQGAPAAALRPFFLPGGRGAVVNASRSVIYAHEKSPGLPWTEAVAQAARAARDELNGLAGAGPYPLAGDLVSRP